ncbi:hypothetical protein [Natronobeatus ordinarius]|uniref:hypothetical protein n=1 Tax=Natronobeatus ordinarius TaxID=2963433 RepID=UPI0020CE48DC|nr:hypothetical protein [Natronobeatus ordinarius]
MICEIVAVNPDAQYSGTTYTQTVCCQVENGTEISVFDSTPPIVDDAMRGNRIDAMLLARARDITISSEVSRTINPGNGTDCVYVGEVVGVASVGTSQIQALEVNVDIGTVYVEPDADFVDTVGAVESTIGELVTVDAYRTDIVDFDAA